MVMFLLTLRVDVHVAVPAGIATVSPLLADVMAARTLRREGLEALTIVACAALERAKAIAAMTQLSTAYFSRDPTGESESKGRCSPAPPAASQLMPN